MLVWPFFAAKWSMFTCGVPLAVVYPKMPCWAAGLNIVRVGVMLVGWQIVLEIDEEECLVLSPRRPGIWIGPPTVAPMFLMVATFLGSPRSSLK